MIGGNRNRVKVGSPVKQLTQTGERLMRFAIQNETARLLSTKLTLDPNKSRYAQNGKDEPNAPKVDIIQNLSQRAVQKLNDIENIYEILPDTETAETIMVSSILSPNDLITEELIWSVNGDFPAEIGTVLMDLVREAFDKDYKINGYLSQIFREAIYRKGAYIFAIFPESAVDDIINAKTSLSEESYQNGFEKAISGRGLLGNNEKKKETTSFENFFRYPSKIKATDKESIVHPNLLVTDNPDILKVPTMQKKVADERIRQAYGMESFGQCVSILNPKTMNRDDNTQIVNTLYQDQTGVRAAVVQVNDNQNGSRGSIGRPLLKQMPFECCIPVHEPGDPDKHVGYFFLIDKNGNPVSKELEADNFNRLAQGLRQNIGVNAISSLISEMKYYEQGMCSFNENDKNLLDELESVYISLVERDLLARLNNGVYGDNVEIGKPQEIYRIMLARALMGMQTQLLFMPSSLVQYIAFEYDKFGMGVSLVGKARTLAAQRSTLIFANNMAMIRNSVPKQLATIKIDPAEADPWMVYEASLTKITEANAMSFMYHAITPETIENALNRAGWELRVEGHPDIPEHMIETDYKSGERPLIDDTVLEKTDKRWFMSLKVPPALIENSSELEFATQFVAQHALFNRVRREYANKGSAHLSDLVRKVVLADGALLRSLTGFIRANVAQLPKHLQELAEGDTSIPIIKAFLEQLEVGLPQSNNERDKEQLEAFSSFKSKVEELIPLYFNRDDIALLLPEIDTEEDPNGEIKMKVLDRIEDYIKAVVLRKWVADNGIFPEINEIFRFDSPQPNLEFLKTYNADTERMVKAIQEVVAIIFAKNSGAGGEAEVSDTADSSSTDDDNTSDDSSSDSDTDSENDEEEESGEDDSDDSEEESSDDKDEGKGDKDDDADDIMNMMNSMPGGDE
jgi:virion structural protein|nr:MAG TPA: capsid assembly protein [Caudoviricetes sp.]